MFLSLGNTRERVSEHLPQAALPQRQEGFRHASSAPLTLTLCPPVKCPSILFLTGGNGSVVKLVVRSHTTAQHRRGILNQFGLALKPKVFSRKACGLQRQEAKDANRRGPLGLTQRPQVYKQTPMGLDKTLDVYSSDRGLDTRLTICLLSGPLRNVQQDKIKGAGLKPLEISVSTGRCPSFRKSLYVLCYTALREGGA